MAQRIVRRGSMVLVRYPFTDLTNTKVRPAVVLTPDHLMRQTGFGVGNRMNVLDENNPCSQRQLLRSWRTRVRQISNEISRQATKVEV